MVFVDLDSGRFLPDSYIILNFPTREGIRIACVSRIDGTLLSLTSLNDTVSTSLYCVCVLYVHVCGCGNCVVVLSEALQLYIIKSVYMYV